MEIPVLKQILHSLSYSNFSRFKILPSLPSSITLWLGCLLKSTNLLKICNIKKIVIVSIKWSAQWTICRCFCNPKQNQLWFEQGFQKMPPTDHLLHNKVISSCQEPSLFWISVLLPDCFPKTWWSNEISIFPNNDIPTSMKRGEDRYYRIYKKIDTAFSFQRNK